MGSTTGTRLPYEYVVAVVYVCGMFMNIMDSTIVNTALPAIARQFHTTPSAADWIVIGYLLSLAVWIPASGWVGDRIGTKTTFLFALLLFTLASVLCGLASSLNLLVIFRVIQGVGGGMLAPVGQAMLYRAFPPERRAQASSILMLATVLAPASGPVIGGLLVDQLSWRWVFYVNVPIGIAAFIFGLLFLREHREARAGRFDLPGFVLTGVGMALWLYAISEGPLLGWGSVQVVVAGVVGLLGIMALIRIELNRAYPMLNFRLLGDRLFRSTNLVSFIGSAAFLGVLFVMPQFLQEARGVSALNSGLTTFPEAIGVLLSSRLVARLYPRVGPRRLMFSGLIAVTAAMVLLMSVSLDTSMWLIRFLMFAIGVGWAYVVLPLQAASFAGISSADTGRASAIFNTQRQVAGAMGVAIFSTILSATLMAIGGGHVHISPAEQVGAYHVTFAVAAVIALMGSFAALTIRDVDAAATMKPRVRRGVVTAPAIE